MRNPYPPEFLRTTRSSTRKRLAAQIDDPDTPLRRHSTGNAPANKDAPKRRKPAQRRLSEHKPSERKPDSAQSTTDVERKLAEKAENGAEGEDDGMTESDAEWVMAGRNETESEHETQMEDVKSEQEGDQEITPMQKWNNKWNALKESEKLEDMMSGEMMSKEEFWAMTEEVYGDGQ